MDKRRVNVRAIIWRQGKLLAVKHKSKDGGESDYWALPGGGLDPLETLEDGITREIIEELGVTPKIGRLLIGQQLKSGRNGRDEELEFFFHVANPNDFTSIDLAATTHGAKELMRCEFIDPAKEHILPQFLGEINLDDYISDVKPVTFANHLG